MTWSLKVHLAVATTLRLLLICYGRIHDAVFEVRFTDIDYSVFSDAARYVAAGRSPYDRATYRYTPLIAWILTPNIWLDAHDFGKLLFTIFDLISAVLVYRIVRREMENDSSSLGGSIVGAAVGNDQDDEDELDRIDQDEDEVAIDQQDVRDRPAIGGDKIEDQKEEIVNNIESKSITSACLVLYNPLNAVVAARGNAESLLSTVVLLILYFLYDGSDRRRSTSSSSSIITSSYFRWILIGFLHGLAVHLKIYPLIYLPSIFFASAQIDRPSIDGWKSTIHRLITNHRGIVYGLSCSLSFVVLTYVFYRIYGQIFLDEALLYHLSRRDIKHNFSPYFYPLYLTEGHDRMQNLIGSIAFIPQAILVLVFSWKYRRDLPFAWFASTFAFVAFNKVCTSQYFVWYLALVPLVWYKCPVSRTKSIRMIGAWTIAQAVWLGAAYLLEFRGWNVFVYVWLASLAFLLVNCWLLATTCRAYDDRDRVIELRGKEKKHS